MQKYEAMLKKVAQKSIKGWDIEQFKVMQPKLFQIILEAMIMGQDKLTDELPLKTDATIKFIEEKIKWAKRNNFGSINISIKSAQELIDLLKDPIR